MATVCALAHVDAQRAEIVALAEAATIVWMLTFVTGKPIPSGTRSMQSCDAIRSIEVPQNIVQYSPNSTRDLIAVKS